MEGTVKIHTENILPIIKKWLYSDKEIFVRELVSNACDALTKLKVLGKLSDPRIDITLDKKNRTLTFSDTGIGMSSAEIEKYIAQIAFSGAEEFVAKYKAESGEVIGHFGLGFYSAYMVASKVTIDTLSYEEGATPAFWSCEGSTTYTLEQGTRTQRGTTITLFIDEESSEYLEEPRLRSILQRYCGFLPYPIFLGEERINPDEPLWMKQPSECTENDYRAFYRKLYPFEPEPHFWVHLNIDVPFHLKGILYFPKLHRRFDYQKNQIQLFCNRVFVSDNCQDIVPDYLLVLRGVLDSPDIPLNVSRSTLQVDPTVRSVAAHLSKKVADKLTALYRSDPKAFQDHFEEISLVLKLGIMQDEKFYDRMKECLLWKTTKGDFVSLENRTGTVFYTQDLEAPHLALYKDVEVLHASSPVDTALMSFLERKQNGLRLQRIDGAVNSTVLDETKEKNLLDAEGKTEAGRIADFFRDTLQIEVEAKSLSSEKLPALLSIDEEMRRARDYMALTGTEMNLPSKQTLIVNTNSPLIQAVYKAQDETLARQVYNLTRLSHKELPSSEMAPFIEQMTQLLEKCVGKVSLLDKT